MRVKNNYAGKAALEKELKRLAELQAKAAAKAAAKRRRKR